MEFCSPTSRRQPHQRRGRWEVGARLGERLARGEGAANVVALVRWFVGWLVGWLVNHGKSMGKPWENCDLYGKSPFSMGKSTISMAIFHSYFDITRG